MGFVQTVTKEEIKGLSVYAGSGKRRDYPFDKAGYQNLLSTFSDADFDDTAWSIHIHSSGKKFYVTFPTDLATESRVLLKACFLNKLAATASPQCQSIICRGADFLRFLEQKNLGLDACRSSTVNLFVKALDENQQISDFVRNETMRVVGSLIEAAAQLGWLRANQPIDCSHRWKERRSQSKRAPDMCVIYALDELLFDPDSDIELAYRCIYLLLRMISNRISEVLSMSLDCVSYPEPGVFTLYIPTSKETPYHLPQINPYYRNMDGRCEGILLKSILKQKERAASVQMRLSDNLKNLLFVDGGKLVTADKFNAFLQKLIQDHTICDESGKLAVVTSHDFRHVAIGERLRSGIIPQEDVQRESNHALLDQTFAYGYASKHDEGEHLKEALTTALPEAFADKKEQNEAPTELAPVKYERLKSQPFTRILPGYGLCGNAGCTPRFELCLQCKNFQPDALYIDYFSECIAYLKKKIALLERKQGNPEAIAFNEKQLAMLQRYIDLFGLEEWQSA